MKDEEIVNLVLKKTKETVGLSKTPKIFDSFVNDLMMDSLDTIEYIMMVEEEFDIIIKDEEAEKIDTIADLIKIIKDKKK